MPMILSSCQLLSIVATGGVMVPKQPELIVYAWLTCHGCGQKYPMQPGALGLITNCQTAQVRESFVEVCPYCKHEHGAGEVLTIGEK
jgi:hypothetical protein